MHAKEYAAVVRLGISRLDQRQRFGGLGRREDDVPVRKIQSIMALHSHSIRDEYEV